MEKGKQKESGKNLEQRDRRKMNKRADVGKERRKREGDYKEGSRQGRTK